MFAAQWTTSLAMVQLVWPATGRFKTCVCQPSTAILMAEESAVWFKMCFYSAEGLINKDSALGPKVWKKGATKKCNECRFDWTGFRPDIWELRTLAGTVCWCYSGHWIMRGRIWLIGHPRPLELGLTTTAGYSKWREWAMDVNWILKLRSRYMNCWTRVIKCRQTFKEREYNWYLSAIWNSSSTG